MIRTELVDVARLARALARTPTLAARLFTDAERRTDHGAARTVASLAGRWAAKCAAVRLLGGGPADLRRCEVRTGRGGRPVLHVTGTPGVRWHVSISHEANVCAAVVLAESDPARTPEPGTAASPGTRPATGPTGRTGRGRGPKPLRRST